MTAVIRRGLRDQRRAILIWSAWLGVLGAFVVAIYPSIEDVIGELSDSYPSGLREAFGIDEISSIEGYVHTEMFSFVVPLAIAYFAVHALAAAIAGREERGELDTLLALPLPRRTLLLGTFAVVCAAAAAILALCGLVTFVAGRIAGTGIDLGAVAAATAGTWGLAVFAAGLATLAGGALHRARSVTAVGLGVVVAMYVLEVTGRLSEPLDPARWASAFRYYGSPLLDGLDWAGLATLVAAGIALAVAGARLFERRDVLSGV